MKYIKEVIIENFQSHKYTHLKFVNGLNTIIGESDKGKSAIIRAIKWVMLNEPQGNSIVRDKCSECSVTLVFNDNTTVKRVKILKGKKTITSKNIYIITYPDGTKSENENFGTDVPDEVLDACGVRILKIDKDLYEVPNFLFQLEAPFLISSTAANRSKTIGKLINANLFDCAIRDIQSDILDVSKKIRETEKNLENLKNEITKYDNLEKEEENLKKIENLISIYEKKQENIDTLKSYIKTLENIKTQKQKMKSIIYSFKDIQRCELLFKDINLKQSMLDNLLSIKNKIKTLDKNKQNLKATLDNLKNIDLAYSLLEKLNENLNTLKELNKFKQNLKLLNEKADKLRKIKITLSNIENADTLYNNLLNKIEKIEKLKQINQTYKETKEKINIGKKYLGDIETDLSRKAKLYSDYLKKMGKCPTCFSDIDNKRIDEIIFKNI
ncbi:AAA domain-containing protein [Alkalithermobacter thermoalcaliphilus JW-YL-7 = DSM 7308]|uniref:Nuclease SbcCD subunit C n=1 Tax=Alkalithermobacter thermoalcaliphilus JW-YL-7 = DSM 7308 TaxID=1121328 RepID=A0A150FSN3_CLOPD|nr:hypothetical protein JWYL7_1663 [[Clostridium] paradoxum JW-YL-7 = DSM 7308]SHK69691.1 AAA domain-containing protein [[Clostridium] paradoxum JW-YL-7 = DSM 7308]